MDELDAIDMTATPESHWRLVLRVCCIVVELALVLWLGKQGDTFFYQGF